MYQQPQTQMRPTTRPGPKWQLGGRQVSQAMFYDAEKAKRSGRRVLLVSAGGSDIGRALHDQEDCANCNGFGQFGLEIIVAGPFENAPQGKGGNDDGEGVSIQLRPAWHNNAWWQVVRSIYHCPVCNDRREIVL